MKLRTVLYRTGFSDYEPVDCVGVVEKFRRGRKEKLYLLDLRHLGLYRAREIMYLDGPIEVLEMIPGIYHDTEIDEYYWIYEHQVQELDTNERGLGLLKRF